MEVTIERNPNVRWICEKIRVFDRRSIRLVCCNYSKTFQIYILLSDYWAHYSNQILFSQRIFSKSLWRMSPVVNWMPNRRALLLGERTSQHDTMSSLFIVFWSYWVRMPYISVEWGAGHQLREDCKSRSFWSRPYILTNALIVKIYAEN